MLKTITLLMLLIIPGLAQGLPQNGKSLGIYKGDVGALAAKEIGSFKLAVSNPADAEMLKALNGTAGLEDLYQSSDNRKLMVILVNFPTAEAAKAGLKVFQKHEFDSWTILEQGPKQINGSPVGERVVVREKGSEAGKGDRVVLWTNGSVLFIVGTRGVDDSSPTEFEKSFSY
jgi:hypothetical protein